MLTGGVDTGWTFYTPFSTAFRNTKVVEARLAIFIAGFSSILTGLNFIVTIHRMRAPGHDLVPPAAVYLVALCHQHHSASGTPVLAITLLLLVAASAPCISASSIPSWAAIRCCSSICSGSTPTLRFTS